MRALFMDEVFCVGLSLVHGDIVVLVLDLVPVAARELLEQEGRVEDGEHDAGEEEHGTVADEETSLVLHQVTAPASLHLGDTNSMEKSVKKHPHERESQGREKK
jgi:hypothetical protein